MNVLAKVLCVYDFAEEKNIFTYLIIEDAIMKGCVILDFYSALFFTKNICYDFVKNSGLHQTPLHQICSCTSNILRQACTKSYRCLINKVHH